MILANLLAKSGPIIGLGHVSRCQALSDALTQLGAQTKLYTNYLPTQLAKSELLIVDVYDLTHADYERLSISTKHLAVVDDWGRSDYPAQILINPGLGAEKIHYNSKFTLLLRGASYSLLKKEFWSAVKQPKTILPKIKTLLISLGGTVPQREVKYLASLIKNKSTDFRIELATGQHSTREMIKLMRSADVAVSGAGQTLSELACLGVPTIAIQIADNQTSNFNNWQKVKFVRSRINYSNKSYPKQVAAELKFFTPTYRSKVSQIGQQYVDGQGAIKAATALLKFIHVH